MMKEEKARSLTRSRGRATPSGPSARPDKAPGGRAAGAGSSRRRPDPSGCGVSAGQPVHARCAPRQDATRCATRPPASRRSIAGWHTSRCRPKPAASARSNARCRRGVRRPVALALARMRDRDGAALRRIPRAPLSHRHQRRAARHALRAARNDERKLKCPVPWEEARAKFKKDGKRRERGNNLFKRKKFCRFTAEKRQADRLQGHRHPEGLRPGERQDHAGAHHRHQGALPAPARRRRSSARASSRCCRTPTCTSGGGRRCKSFCSRRSPTSATSATSSR